MTLGGTREGCLPFSDDVRAEIAQLQAELPTLADPSDAPTMLALVRLLHRAGRRDLALGRLFEGHVDALQIVARYGTADQAAEAYRLARGGALFGVWNAPLPGEPLRVEQGALTGGKSFASGAGILTHALVTTGAGDAGKVQLYLVDLARLPPRVDRDWWLVTGMARSETHLVRWSGAALPGDAAIGGPGDYEREPWFSGGALRFVAVHAGGVAALFEHVRDHLVATGRTADPVQAGRLARLFSLADSAALAVRGAAERWHEQADDAKVAGVASVRLAVADFADEAIAEARRAVGVQAGFETHPLSRVIGDLLVYLCQPGPDAAAARLADGAARGIVDPAP